MPALRTRDNQSRSLEVTTDAPQPPTLAIISPTPRAFTFPITHNLADSPYSTPSHSPFEPDLYSFPSTQCITPPPQPTFMRTLSPDPSLRSSSPSSPSHKRRKSSCSSEIIERRPKKGDEDYIKRPENAFILFRRKCCEDRQAAQEEASIDGPTKKQRQADLSKTISQQWKGLSAEERQYWEQLAKEKKKEHEQMYPNYVYRPQRANKDGRSKSKKPVKGRRGEFDHDTDSESVTFVLPMAPRHHGRSASAPTPPPYQSIQVPNVYMTTSPSCPTSPSLLPMISRRSSHPGQVEDLMNNFDYHSDNHFLSPPFGIGPPFEASLQSSEFMRNIFILPAYQGSPLDNIPMPHNHHNHHTLLPSISSASSVGSGSSGPSSPREGPFTPMSSTMSSEQYSRMCSSDPRDCSHEYSGLSAEEQEPQLDMRLNEPFPDFSWNGNTDIWANSDDVLTNDDFNLDSIAPVQIIPNNKYSGDMSLGEPSGLEFGHEFTQALEGSQGYCEPQMNPILAFDEIYAGNGF